LTLSIHKFPPAKARGSTSA